MLSFTNENLSLLSLIIYKNKIWDKVEQRVEFCLFLFSYLSVEQPYNSKVGQLQTIFGPRDGNFWDSKCQIPGCCLGGGENSEWGGGGRGWGTKISNWLASLGWLVFVENSNEISHYINLSLVCTSICSCYLALHYVNSVVTGCSGVVPDPFVLTTDPIIWV